MSEQELLSQLNNAPLSIDKFIQQYFPGFLPNGLNEWQKISQYIEEKTPYICSIGQDNINLIEFTSKNFQEVLFNTEDLISFVYGPTAISRGESDVPDRNTEISCSTKSDLYRFWIANWTKLRGKLAVNYAQFQQIQYNRDKPTVNICTLDTWTNRYFLRDNIKYIIESNTNVFLMLPSGIKWFDMNPSELGAEHNWGDRSRRGDNPDKFGDMIYIIVPINKKEPIQSDDEDIFMEDAEIEDFDLVAYQRRQQEQIEEMRRQARQIAPAQPETSDINSQASTVPYDDINDFGDINSQDSMDLSNYSNQNLENMQFNDVHNYENFSRSNLTDAVLSGEFIGTNFTGANLTRAELSGGDFTGADFTNANLTDVETFGATFRNANFTDATYNIEDLYQTDIEGAVGLDI